MQARRLAPLFWLIVAVACADLVTEPGGALGGVRGIRLDSASVTLDVGGSSQVTATLLDGQNQPVLPATGQAISYTSADPTILAADPATGGLTGLSAGSTSVTASYNALSVTIPAIVLPALPVIVPSTTTAAFSATVGGGDPAEQTVQVTNGAGGTLSGLTASIAYAASQPTGWLTAALDGSTAPTVLHLDVATGTLPAGSYSASVTLHSTLTGVADKIVAVTFTVGAAPDIGLSPNVLSFSAVQGGGNPAPQSVAVTNAGGGALTGLSAVVSYAAGQPTGWLGATLGGTTAPASLTAQVTTGALTSGSYAATITVASTVAGVPAKTVSVTFTITAPPPSIALGASALTFNAVAGGTSPAQQTVAVTNGGGGTLSGLATAIQYGTGEPTGWLAAPVAPATAPATVTAAATLGALLAGSYHATVTVSSTVPGVLSQTFSVTFVVAPATPVIDLAQSSLTFNGVAGGASPAAQTVAVTNGGGGTLSGLSTSISYGASQPTGWLTAPIVPATAPATITATASTGALAAGTYTATVTVASTVAGVASHTLNVTFVVAPAAPAIALSQGALSFNATAGGADPAGQTVNVTNGGGGTLSGLSTSISYGASQPTGWLAAPIAPSAAPATISAAASTGALPAGTYTATLTVSSTVSGVVSQTIAVTFTVTAPGPSISLASTSLAFTATTGGADPSAQTDAVTNGGGGTLSGLSTSISYGASQPTGWLAAPVAPATAPATITATATTGALPAGTYTATITVSSTVSGVSSRTIAVTFTVAAASGPVIQVTPTSYSIPAFLGGPNPPALPIAVTNGGTGTLSGLSATITYTGTGGWLAATFNGGMTTAPTALTLQATTGALPAGVFHADVTISSTVAGVTPVVVPITLTITAQPPLIVITPSTLSLELFQGAAPPAPQPINVTNGGGGTLTGLSASVNYGIAPPVSWLTATLNQTTAPATLTLTYNTATLPEGTYGAQVTLHSTDPSVIDQSLVIGLLVTAQVTPVIVATPNSQTFTAASGSGTTAAKTVAITNGGGGTLDGLSLQTNYGAAQPTGWLTASLNTTTAPATLTLTADAGAPVAVPGTYSATVVISSTIQTVLPVSVTVTFTVTASGPVIGLSSTALNFSAFSPGADPTAQQVSLTNDGIGSLTGLSTSIAYGGGEPTGWLTAGLGATTAPTIINVSAAKGALPVGVYHATITVASTVSGVASRTITVTFGILASPATTLGAASNLNQAATVGAPVAAPPSVIARDAGNNPVPNVPVTFSVAAGNGTLTGATVSTNALGVATVGSWTLPNTPATYTLTATSPGLNTVTFTAIATAGPAATVVKISGDAQAGASGAALAQPLVVEVRDQFGNPVTIPATVNWTVSDGSVNPTTGATAAGRAQTTWTLGTTQASPTATATVTGLTPVTFSATAVTTTLSLAFASTVDVGIGHSVAVRATLSVPAPAGGRVVTVTSDNPGIVSVAGAGTITIAQGQTTGTINVNGVAIGSTTLRGNSPGLAQASLPISVFTRAISVPPTLNVPFAQTASLPINIGQPAPAGGVVVTLTTSNGTAVGLQSTTVTIPAGQLAANAIVQGLLPGSSNVTASNPDFDQDVSVVTTTASFNILQGSVSLNASFGASMDIQFQSQGVGIAAPSPGIPVTFTSLDAGCAVATSPVTIGTGLVQISDSIHYGGTTALPCSTRIIASAPNIAPDTIQVSVAPRPDVSLSRTTVGRSLQVGVGVNLGASNHGGTTVRVTSGDPTKILVSSSPTAGGSAFIDIPIAPNASGATYYVQGLEGQTGLSVVTATAPGFNDGAASDSVVQSGFDILSVPATTTSFAPNSGFQIRLGIPNAVNSGLAAEQPVRGGVPAPVIATVSNSNGAVAQLVFQGSVAQSGPVVIPVNSARTPGSAATGGVEFDPLGPGTTIISATVPGFLAMPGATATAVVNAPDITTSTATLGVGLQAGSGGQLGSSLHGGVTVHIVSADPTRLLIARDAATPGAASLDIPLLNGSTGFAYTLQAIEGMPAGRVNVTVTAPGFNPVTVSDSLAETAIDLLGLNGASTTPQTPDIPFQARIGTVNTAHTSLTAEQPIRAGGPAVTVTVTNTTPALADLVSTATTGDVVTTTIEAEVARSPGSVGTGGVAFHAVAQGTAVVNATAPGLIVIPTASASVTIIASTISSSIATVGSGLQRGVGGNLSSSNHGGVTVHLVSGDPGKLLLAANATTVGAATLDIPVPNGQTGFSYTLQGIEGQVGLVPVTISAPGFTTTAVNDSVAAAGYDVLGVPSTTTTFSNNAPFQVRLGVPNQPRTGLVEEQGLRAGADSIAVTITSSVPTVGRLVTSSASGASVTVHIAGDGVARSPGSVSTGGVEFDPLIGGTTVVSASIPQLVTLPTSSASVTVTSPAISLSSTTVGAGLAVTIGGGLGASNHGGVTVRVTSSNPSVALLAPNLTTAGAAFVDIAVPNGQTGFSFVVMGLEGQAQTVSLTASAPGFTDGGSTADVEPTGYDILGLSASTTTFTSFNPFQVRVGPVNTAGTSLAAEQQIRFGGSPLTATVTSSVPGIGRLYSKAASGGSVSLTIPVGLARSPGDTTSGGAAFDAVSTGTTVVQATIAGLVRTNGGTQTVTVATPALSLSATTVGAGLQVQVGGSLGASQHGGTTVRVTSTDPTKVVISRDGVTPGAAFIDIPLTNGTSGFSYYLQGVDGKVARVNVTAAAPGYSSDQVADSVAAPAIDLLSLPASISAGGATTAFQVRTGIPNSLNTGLAAEQSVRGDESALVATVTNSAAGVAQLVTTPLTGQSVTTSIQPGVARSGGSVLLGGVAFDPLAQGSTTVQATIPGFVVLPSASVAVNVGP